MCSSSPMKTLPFPGAWQARKPLPQYGELERRAPERVETYFSIYYSCLFSFFLFKISYPEGSYSSTKLTDFKYLGFFGLFFFSAKL